MKGGKGSDRTRSSSGPGTPAICANGTYIGASCGSIGYQANRSFERLKEGAGGVAQKELPVPDVARQLGVGCVPGLLPDLECRDAPRVALVAKPARRLWPEYRQNRTLRRAAAITFTRPSPVKPRGFADSEPEAEMAPRPARRPPTRIHRTSRTVQFNARTTPQTVEAVYAIAYRRDGL